MPSFGYQASQASTYSQPILTYPTVAGFTGVASFAIPLLLTVYAPPDTKPTITQIGTMPIIYRNNLAQSSDALGAGIVSLPRIQLEGSIDTPTVAVGNYMLPTLMETATPNLRMHWADFIFMCFEGRAIDGQRVDPVSFRDPYGRLFNNPRVLDFTASYVEGVPGRTNFTMSLKV